VTALPSGLPAPARRALERAELESLEEVAAFPRAELAALHGMGPKALRTLDEALAAAGLAERLGRRVAPGLTPGRRHSQT
jgi:hypothetical protein